MRVGQLVEHVSSGRIGTVIKVDNDRIEVRLQSGSRVIASRDYFKTIGSGGTICGSKKSN